jgi:hypothetical protein
MEKSNFKAHISQEKNSPAESIAAFNSCRLRAFFDLLFQIDKRNNPGLYEHNKSGTPSDQTAKRFDSFCQH